MSDVWHSVSEHLCLSCSTVFVVWFSFSKLRLEARVELPVVEETVGEEVETKKIFFFVFEWQTNFSAAVFLTEQSDSEDSSSSWLSSEGVTLWTWIIISLITIIILTALICLFYKTFRSCKKKSSEERIQWCCFDDLKMSRKQLKLSKQRQLQNSLIAIRHHNVHSTYACKQILHSWQRYI